MEQTATKPPLLLFKSYLILTKPGIIMGNTITALGGFFLAAKGNFDLFTLLAMLIGLSGIIGSACVFNNCIDQSIDAKMARTRKRPLIQKIITPKQAMIFATLIGLMGSLVLLMTNFLTLMIALASWLIYVVIYSFSKKHTTNSLLIGSIAGASPPVIGYTAITNQLDSAALLLFLIIVAWQMPHFLAITIYRLEDYEAASIPTIPTRRGILATKIQISCYIVAFTVVASLLSFFGYTGDLYLVAVLILGSYWLGIALKGFTQKKSDKLWARKVFLFSLIVITSLFALIPYSTLK